MKHWCTTHSVLALVALCILAGPSARGQSYDWHTESFLVYLQGGGSLPTGKHGDEYESGFHFGGGIGVVLSSESKLSPELNLRLIYSRVKAKKPNLWDLLYESLGGGETYFGMELRLRIQNGQRLRPFVTLGGGISSGKEDMYADGALVVAGGADLATTSEGHRLIFGELRLVQSSPSLILLSMGLRFG